MLTIIKVTCKSSNTTTYVHPAKKKRAHLGQS